MHENCEILQKPSNSFLPIDVTKETFEAITDVDATKSSGAIEPKIAAEDDPLEDEETLDEVGVGVTELRGFICDMILAADGDGLTLDETEENDLKLALKLGLELGPRLG